MFSSETPDSSTGWAEKTVKTFGGASLSCCMQHVLTVSTYPGSCKTCFSHIPVFGRKVFLIFPIIYLTVDLKLICIIGQSDLINSFDLCQYLPWTTQLLTLGASFPFSRVSWLLNFLRQDMFLFGSYQQYQHTNSIEIT